MSSIDSETDGRVRLCPVEDRVYDREAEQWRIHYTGLPLGIQHIWST